MDSQCKCHSGGTNIFRFYDKHKCIINLDLARNTELVPNIHRLEICQDRWDRRSCKNFPNCVKFWGNNANSLGNYRVIYALNE